MANTEHKNFSSPDETRTFNKGKVELIHLAEAPSDDSSSNRAGAGQKTSNPLLIPNGVKRLISSIKYPVVCTSSWQMVRSLIWDPAMYPSSRRDMTPGSLVTNRSCSSTGLVQANMRKVNLLIKSLRQSRRLEGTA